MLLMRAMPVPRRDRRRLSRILRLLTLPLAAALCAGGVARADDVSPAPPPYGRKAPLLPLRIDGHVALTWEGGFGVGGRAEFPVVKSFRYASRDELAISVGADLAFLWVDGRRTVETYPSVQLQWALGVTERFALVPELGIGARIQERSWDGFIPSLAFGMRYYLSRSFGVSARLGWPVALSGGAIF